MERAVHYLKVKAGACLKAFSTSHEDEAESAEEEDIDVQKERYRIQDGALLTQTNASFLTKTPSAPSTELCIFPGA